MMLAERFKRIEEIVNKKGFISISDLASDVNVSESTIRRDIAYLERENKILRSHGGVLVPDQNNLNLVVSRENKNILRKKSIGEAAAKLVESGDSIFLDSSTTVLEIAKSLPPDLHITAVTNDLTIALELEKKPEINTVVLGGTLRSGTHSLIGPITEMNLKGLFFTKAFIGAGGISMEGHVMNYNLQAIEFRKIVIEMSDQVILAADESKFNKKCFATVAAFDKIHILVTNQIPTTYRKVLEDAGVNIVISI